MIREHEQEGIILEVPRSYEKDPPSDAWHQEEELPRFLEGNEIVEPGVEEDVQRSNFYSAEIWFYKDVEKIESYENTIGSLRDVANFISNIWSSKWWQKRYDKLSTRIISISDDELATATFEGNLLLPSDSKNPESILHELIHFTTPKPHAGHGRLFCARFKEVVGWYWGEEVEDELKEIYELKDIKWRPRDRAPKKYRECVSG